MSVEYSSSKHKGVKRSFHSFTRDAECVVASHQLSKRRRKTDILFHSTYFERVSHHEIKQFTCNTIQESKCISISYPDHFTSKNVFLYFFTRNHISLDKSYYMEIDRELLLLHEYAMKFAELNCQVCAVCIDSPYVVYHTMQHVLCERVLILSDVSHSLCSQLELLQNDYLVKRCLLLSNDDGVVKMQSINQGNTLCINREMLDEFISLLRSDTV
jgi:alkyl hydroperoxide reductase subunit AhpC